MKAQGCGDTPKGTCANCHVAFKASTIVGIWKKFSGVFHYVVYDRKLCMKGTK